MRYTDIKRANYLGSKEAEVDTQHTDIVIVGAGPAGIFTALGLLEAGDTRQITIIEQGLPVEKRHCPKEKTGECVHCQPCRITSGFSGAGAFSDGKLSLSYEVGGSLPDLLGVDRVTEAIEHVDGMYLSFGADEHVEGLANPDAIAAIRRRAIGAGLKLVDCPIRHLGTEMAQNLYKRIEDHLVDAGVQMHFGTTCEQVIVEDGVCKGIVVSDRDGQATINADAIVIAVGRGGAGWLEEVCRANGIARSAGPVDMGVRVEVRNEVMADINDVLYESKLIGYPNPYRDKVRTFCQNPGGYVSQETYEDGLAVVNGHSYKTRKSENTNLAILATHYFREPFDRPTDYAKKVGKLMNMLGAGHILVQRFGDILDGKRTWTDELMRSNVRPTLADAVAGDIASAMPYRTMTDIVSFILAMDKVVPGFASGETLLYAPELKFYSNKVSMDEQFTTSVANLFCLGDSSGWTRGLMMSSVMGYLMGRTLAG